MRLLKNDLNVALRPFFVKINTNFFIVEKVAQKSGRRTCCPSHDKKGLKDWAILLTCYLCKKEFII
jgi:hypothetical protein